MRHDDPRLNAYSAVVQRLQSALTITTEVETLRLGLARETAYDVRVLDDEPRSGCDAGHEGRDVEATEPKGKERPGDRAGRRVQPCHRV